MNLKKQAFAVLEPQMSTGLFVKLKHAFPNPGQMLKALKKPIAPDRRLSIDARIVVVGIGPAAVSMLGELNKAGFRNVTIVSRDQMFGGKCVNFGCMPIEFILGLDDSHPNDNRAKLTEFVDALRGDVEGQVRSFNYPLIEAAALRVSGHSLHLDTGESLPFDRLIVATGGSYPRPAAITDAANIVSISDFWNLPVGSRLTIYAEDNPTALSLGDVALRLGLVPTVILGRNNPLANMPSYKYFVRRLTQRGVKIYEKARVDRVDANEIKFEAGKALAVGFDYLLPFNRAIPNFIEVDGQTPEVYDIDLVRGALPARPDIIFVGDGGGMMTASESDLQARWLMRAWKYGEPLDFQVIGNLPISMHAETSLAIAGKPWTFTASQWAEVDFRVLGWSRAHGLEGKLWYILNPESARIEAVHICHKHASELIALANALMDYPVWDHHWLTCSVHPTAAEIFKTVAEQAMSALPAPGSSRIAAPEMVAEFELPALADIDLDEDLPKWIDQTRWQEAVLSKSPAVRLSVFYGISKLEEITGQTYSRHVNFNSLDRVRLETDPAVVISVSPDERITLVRHAEKSVKVQFST